MDPSTSTSLDAQRKLDALLNNASVAIFMMDAQYECVYMNPAAEKLSGYTLPEMQGRTLHDMLHHTRPDGSHFPLEECPIGLTLEHQHRARGEEVFVHKDGSFYPVAFSAAPMHGADGEVIGTILEARDIRQEKAVLSALEESSRAKDEFLAVLGHELRNPLSPITTSLHLMKMRGQRSRELEVIERQVHHLSRLVDDLLDVSRATRGLIELRKKRVDIAAVIARSVEVARPMLEAREQTLDVQLPAGPAWVDADAARLSQVLTNLLVNASKFSASHTRVTVRCRIQAGRVAVSVKDQGEGIPPDMLDKVFDPFVQSHQDKDRARGGLGLGLAIARNIVVLHGGSIRAESGGPGNGSEFTVDLAQADPRGGTESRAAEPAPGRSGPARRVLLVDDNVDAAETLKALLEAHGHTVAAAHDAAQALRIAPGFAADIALLDVGLPVMDGYELARRLKETVGAGAPQFVALTGYGLPGDHERSRQAGFSAHLVKPVDLDKLLHLLDRGPAPAP
ncbi:PAS domain-containing hybrid sensor histidine kinase/response regulator [Ramlibacter tataouinensis]|uniref:histidine kinase n=1 Tax=Ramlibacter tataouinensis (strain ATCC BAA-407 / DSM 14655 / LMG 21543 / TTB310) TaxID=365046 RepID=F5XZ69_RAMTT|nr:ATP-binding protein [Ramlibacter tataouinensis]AEG93239.1 candidate histidine kinase, hybrid [Ramlibacter tataouinensis TTB310]